MNHYFIIPLVATIAGGLMGILLREALINRIPAILQKSARNITAGLFGAQDLQRALGGRTGFDNVRPLIEGHIGEFLNHKLGKEMPMIGMFIGDKTIAQLKGIFMKELEEIFPLVMDQYIGGLAANLQPQVILVRELSGLSKQKLRAILYQHASTEMTFLPVCGAVAGLAVALLQLIFLFLLA